jgi:hypothetical protein
MRLLRLGNSYETDANLSPGENNVALADRLIESAVGQPVETTSRVIWPDPGLPDLVERWLDRYEPDVVLLVVSSYWFTHVSLPLGLERRYGRLGQRIGRLGERAVAKPWVANNPVAGRVRRFARTSLGGATHFTPEEVCDRMEQCLRLILAREDVAVAVRGPRLAFAPEDTVSARRRSEERRQLVHSRMRSLCEQLHVEYLGYETGAAPQDAREEYQADLVHAGPAEHARQAELEAAVLIRAWQRHTGAHAPSAPTGS